jgi:uncharacterized protein (DUF1697 family)
VAVQVALLRGINLGRHNRISMPELRERLDAAGFGAVRTYVQSGNVVLEAKGSPRTLERKVAEVIATGFGLEIDVVARTRDELAEILERDPLGAVATEPKRYLVTFLSGAPKQSIVKQLEEAEAEPEELAVIGREIYSWHPEGVARSKLWTKLAGRTLGVTATGRNWTTVTKLLAMADE